MLRKIMFPILLMLLLLLSGCEQYSQTSAPTDPDASTTEAALPSSSAQSTQPGHVHQYVAQRVDPTCTAEGYLLHLCDCGHSFMDEIVPQLGHGWSAWQTVQQATAEKTGLQQRSCSRCGERESQILEKLEPGHIHSYREEVIAPGCTENGYHYYICSCGDGYSDQVSPPLGHTFADYISNGDATCTENGTMYALCTICGVSDTIEEEGSALGHIWTDWVLEKEPTVTDEGLKTRQCDRCGATDSLVLDKLPEEHTHEYQKEKVEATCIEGGYDLYICACGDSYREDTSQPKGHTWGQWLVSIQPTTMSEGEKFRSCQECGEKEWATVEKLPGEDSFIFVSWSEKVGRGDEAYVTIQGKPGVEYAITVFYKSGPSTAKGLEPKVADADGYVTWTWRVGGRTALGSFEIVVSGGGETRSIYFTIEE